MKTINKFSLEVISLLFLSFYSYSQPAKKDIVWMHGMNGEKSGFTNLSNLAYYFRGRFAQLDQSFAPLSTVQTKNNGVGKIADFLSTEVSRRSDVGDDDLLFVGHSLGGLVGKELDIRNYRHLTGGLKMSGIITLGSPLSGSKAANSLESSIASNWILGPGAPFNYFIRNVAYNLGRPILGPITGGVLAILVAKLQLEAQRFSLFINGKNDHDFFGQLFTAYGDTWNDLKTGSQGYASKHNYETNTPKINIWGNIPRPVLQTLATNNGNGGSFNGVINYAESMAIFWQWIPDGTFFAREAYAANAYFKYTINGEYCNLIADGISYSTGSMSFNSPSQVSDCYSEIISTSNKVCRKWGWFKWMCKAVVSLYQVIVCTTHLIWGEQTVYYSVPYYPDTDGLVSEYSATAKGQEWRGIPIEASSSDHSELAETNKVAQRALTDIFNGINPLVPASQRKVFMLR